MAKQSVSGNCSCLYRQWCYVLFQTQKWPVFTNIASLWSWSWPWSWRIS